MDPAGVCAGDDRLDEHPSESVWRHNGVWRAPPACRNAYVRYKRPDLPAGQVPPPRLLHDCSQAQEGPRSLLACHGRPGCNTTAYTDWTLHCNVDMQGHDLGEIPGHRAVTPNIRACADSCASTPACKAFTYSYRNESMPRTFNCWLKTRSDIHDDTDMRNTKRPDCCIDVVTVLRPTAIEPPAKWPGGINPDYKAKLDAANKVFGIVSGLMSVAIAALAVALTCMVHKSETKHKKEDITETKQRRYEAAHTLFHSYAEVEKYVDQLWCILYGSNPPISGKEIARRCVNNCDMQTGRPWAAPPHNELVDLALAKAKVNAWLEDICYHTQGVGVPPDRGSLHEALQLITPMDACDYRFEIRKCLEVVVPFNWVWHQLNTPATNGKIARHQREVQSGRLLRQGCAARNDTPFDNPIVQDFMTRIGCENADNPTYVATGAQSNTTHTRRTQLLSLWPPPPAQEGDEHGGERLLE